MNLISPVFSSLAIASTTVRRSMNEDGKLALKFAPGTRYNYSGEGFEFLKMVIEKITNKKVEQVLQGEVIRPRFGKLRLANHLATAEITGILNAVLWYIKTWKWAMSFIPIPIPPTR